MNESFGREPAELVVVANRLPVEPDPDGGWRPAPGGLVSAMEPVLRQRRAVWIGWAGRFADPDEPDQVAAVADEATDLPDAGFDLAEVLLPEADFAAYYSGFSNGALWPLYHDAIVRPAYHRTEFEAYRRVNAVFARAVAERAGPGATVWVHDYQLQLVPALLRLLRPDLRIGFFLHIPFPPVELFSQLPWRRQVLQGMLGADVVGFQTQDAAWNFMRLVRRFLGLRPTGGHVVVEDVAGPRRVAVDGFPIGIRAADFSQMAVRPEIQERARQIRADLGDPETLLLGVDRLDYTKGIDVRLRAVGELIEDEVLDGSSTVLLQLAIPSRADVEEYQRIRDEVELLVGRVNGDMGRVGAPPIVYLRQGVDREELVAMYLAADVMLVTPLRDGMNLVAKEYVACRIEPDGALVLSEFTGAAAQMTEAWLVNPFDIDGLKAEIAAAVEAGPEETARRMIALRHGVFRNDVLDWAGSFLARLEGGGR